MKLIWNEPPKTNPPWVSSTSLWWERAVIGWLNCMGVWPHTNPEHWSCSYNRLYHFFDITVYECWLPGNGKPDHVISAMRSYLKNSGLDWEEMSTYIWDNQKQRPGVRFWIQAEDCPRSVPRLRGVKV